jgi:hypothetical protein
VSASLRRNGAGPREHRKAGQDSQSERQRARSCFRIQRSRCPIPGRTAPDRHWLFSRVAVDRRPFHLALGGTCDVEAAIGRAASGILRAHREERQARGVAAGLQRCVAASSALGVQVPRARHLARRGNRRAATCARVHARHAKARAAAAAARSAFRRQRTPATAARAPGLGAVPLARRFACASERRRFGSGQPALAPCPQPLRDRRVDRVGPDTVVTLGLDRRDVAVLAVHAAAARELRAGRAPDRRCGTLFDGLEAADPAGALDDELQLLGIVVARQISLSGRRPARSGKSSPTGFVDAVLASTVSSEGRSQPTG